MCGSSVHSPWECGARKGQSWLFCGDICHRRTVMRLVKKSTLTGSWFGSHHSVYSVTRPCASAARGVCLRPRVTSSVPLLSTAVEPHGLWAPVGPFAQLTGSAVHQVWEGKTLQWGRQGSGESRVDRGAAAFQKQLLSFFNHIFFSE